MQEYKVKIEENEINLKVIYEDNHIIVVEKPANIPSQGDKTGDLDMLTIIKAYLKEKYNKPGNVYLGLVHRLDRPVGGVMVFAKTSKAAARLSEQVREKVHVTSSVSDEIPRDRPSRGKGGKGSVPFSALYGLVQWSGMCCGAISSPAQCSLPAG